MIQVEHQGFRDIVDKADTHNCIMQTCGYFYELGPGKMPTIEQMEPQETTVLSSVQIQVEE